MKALGLGYKTESYNFVPFKHSRTKKVMVENIVLFFVYNLKKSISFLFFFYRLTSKMMAFRKIKYINSNRKFVFWKENDAFCFYLKLVFVKESNVHD